MSIALMSATFAQPVDAFRSVAQRFVMLAIADAANDEGVCWPYEATIAAKTGMSVGHARRCIRGLVDDGWLSTERRRRPGGELGGNTYTIAVERLLTSARPRTVVEGDHRAPARATSAHGSAVDQRAPARDQEPSVLEPPENRESAATSSPRRGRPLTGTMATADEVTMAWWEWWTEQNGRRPMIGYVAARNIVHRAIDAGYPTTAVKHALASLGRGGTSVLSFATLERALNQGGARPSRAADAAAARLDELAGA